MDSTIIIVITYGNMFFLNSKTTVIVEASTAEILGFNHQLFLDLNPKVLTMARWCTTLINYRYI